jgi:hypothetical protein
MFTPFPKVPIELRLKIWKDAALVRRVIQIGWYAEIDEHGKLLVEHSSEKNMEQRDITWPHSQFGYEVVFVGYAQKGELEVRRESIRGLNHLAEACRESRQVVLKNFQTLSPRSLGCTKPFKNPQDARLYVNFHLDTICCNDWRVSAIMAQAGKSDFLDNVQRFAIKAVPAGHIASFFQLYRASGCILHYAFHPLEMMRALPGMTEFIFSMSDVGKMEVGVLSLSRIPGRF